ncbi:hypothetical protein ACSV5M_21180 [Cellvibrio sp. ARAG 10.3]
MYKFLMDIVVVYTAMRVAAMVESGAASNKEIKYSLHNEVELMVSDYACG